MSYLEELLPEFRKGYILGEIKGNKFHFVTPDGRVLSFAKDKPLSPRILHQLFKNALQLRHPQKHLYL